MKIEKMFYSLAIIFITLLMQSCRSSSSPIPTPSMAVSPASTENPLSATETMKVPSMPTQYVEFPNISDLLKATRFQIMLPASIPENMPFTKAWITDFSNGNQNVRLLYSEPGNALDANLKLVDIQMTLTDESITSDTIAHQFKITPLDVQEVQVRGQKGFAYWIQSGAAGNSACLAWREGIVNFSISLFGNWPPPNETNPHGLDVMLIMIANSLQAVQY
jgi:hypothetical protein